MRMFLLILLILIAPPLAYFEAISYAHADKSKIPPLESGDLIFNTPITHQTTAIILATGSIYAHAGVIHKHGDGTYTVIQARRRVDETPLSDFIESGWGERFTIKRYPDLTEVQKETVVKKAEQYIGRGYNYSFYMPSKEVYCSEIPYFAYRDANLSIGHEEKISELFVNNSAVHKLFEERWQKHPACQKPGTDYEACWKIVMQEPIITPVSVARDSHLTTVYSNYLF
jgi:hypothetical protein